MDEVDIQLELEQKALSALSSIMAGLESGLITNAQAHHSLRVLFDTTSGLVGGEVFEMISEASKDISSSRTTQFSRNLLVSPNGTIVELEYEYGEAIVRVKSRVPSENAAQWTKIAETSYADEPIPFDAAKHRIEQYKGALLRQGYQILSES